MIPFLQQFRTNGGNRKNADLSTSGESAFVYTGSGHQKTPEGTTRIRVDRSARHLDGHVDYGRIFSLELPEGALRMDVNVTQGTSCLAPSKAIQAMQMTLSSYKARDVFKGESMRSLRNVAFPPDLSDKDLPTFDLESDLGRVLPARRNPAYIYRLLCNGYALRNRFDGLALHHICYYHSHDTKDVAVRSLQDALERRRHLANKRSRGRDCLMMNPLHILACATKHHMKMYQMLVTESPEYLIEKDVWGDLPLLYTIWGRSPREVVDFLLSSIKEYHATYAIDWEKITATLCAGLAPLTSVQYLFGIMADVGRSLNRELHYDVHWNHMIELLCTEGNASENHVKKFISLYQIFFPTNNSDLSMVSLELAERRKFGFKKFWLRIGVLHRLCLLEKEEWRLNIESLIIGCPTGSSAKIVKKRLELMKAILCKIRFYETVAQLWVLELALWKAKIEESKSAVDGKRNKSCRSHSQVTCGADVVIPNVFEYLIGVP